jgi:nucleotide-binding universal stress UspA family protein
MKRFTIATDFSEASLNAMRIAVNLAKVFQAHLQIVHVCKSCMDDTLNPSERTTNQKHELEKKLENLVSQHQQVLNGKIDYHIREGRVYKVVVNQAKYTDADLIIAGTHGVSGFEEFFMGSNAYRIVSSSHCPTITINEKFSKDNFQKILLPIDDSVASRQKVPFTADLARGLNAKIYVLGINSYDDDNIHHTINIYCKQAVDHLKSKGVESELNFTTNRKVANAVLEYAESIDADLISIMSDIEDDALKPLLGSEVQKIVNHSKIPVLTSHPRENFNYEISYTGVTG